MTKWFAATAVLVLTAMTWLSPVAVACNCAGA